MTRAKSLRVARSVCTRVIGLFRSDAARAFSTDPIHVCAAAAAGHDPPEPNDRFRILCAPMKLDRTAAAADTVIESYARNFFSYYFFFLIIIFFFNTFFFL